MMEILFAPNFASLFSAFIKNRSRATTAVGRAIYKNNGISVIPAKAISFCLKFFPIDDKIFIVNCMFYCVTHCKSGQGIKSQYATYCEYFFHSSIQLHTPEKPHHQQNCQPEIVNRSSICNRLSVSRNIRAYNSN